MIKAKVKVKAKVKLLAAEVKVEQPSAISEVQSARHGKISNQQNVPTETSVL